MTSSAQACQACRLPWRRMFLFFSNKLGCLGSVLVSALGTAVVLALVFLL